MKALMIVDMQNDFVEGGSLGVTGGKSVASRLAKDFEELKSNYDLIITTQDWHVEPGSHFAPDGQDPNFINNWPKHCVAGTFGAELVREVHQAVKGSVDITIKKGEYEDAYSGFMGKGQDGDSLENSLLSKSVTHIDIVGIAADYCVAQSAVDASKIGLKTSVLSKYTVPIDELRLKTIIKNEFVEYDIEYK